MTIRLVADGGNCCGLKHLYGFSYDPDFRVSAHESGQVGGNHGYRNMDAVKVSFPAQTMKERFHAQLEALRKNYPYGIVQVTLADGPAKARADGKVSKLPGAPVQHKNPQTKWFPILEAEGFERVNRWYNSNSGNYVVCYQLRMDPAYHQMCKERMKKEGVKKKTAPFRRSSS
ncbi:MAG: hypothetical protein Tp1125DCM00d2C21254131_21 [Prokaryotic dsDNA virus sp.]|nr:MAG: hypothetical protein Tp1125DCM00d2C21254131_21 [Prokaryotic dsDNA virus sp.]|tara:strand:+ start:209 stop:727 length:519 start_codon:yes stop_codon:yes gene_type:complete